MVSCMENDATPQQALAEAERATAALWTDYPPTPSWYYPAVAAWATGYVLAFGALDNLAVLGAASVALGLLAVVFVRWYTNLRGTIPRRQSAPAEFKSAIRAYLLGYILILGATAALFLTVGYLVAAAFMFVTSTAGLWFYERAYERAAGRTRERLA
jgi:hypothetical protein